MVSHYAPWLNYDLNDDGTASTSMLCIKNKYSIQTMDKLWHKWYIKIINPYKI